MDRTENLMTIKALTRDGWRKINNSDDSLDPVRTIKIGNLKNCNDDGIICDPTIKTKMEEVMKKYNIYDYCIEEHINSSEFSYELKLKENYYNEFIKNLNE